MYVTVNLEQHRGQLPCQHTSLSSAVLLSWFTWLFAVLREPIPMFPRKPLSPGVRHVLPLCRFWGQWLEV